MSDVSAAAIYDLLYRLGVTARFEGFFQTAYAVRAAVRQPERLMLVTKWLYPEVAQRYCTGCGEVEKAVRAAAGIAWKSNRPLLEQMAGSDLPRQPGASRFLAILASYLEPEDVA